MPAYNDVIQLAEALMAKRDPYNHHGPRVSILATKFSRILGLSEHEIEMMGYSGYLHDIGKLLVREDILNIPRKLTISEKATVKIHAQEGYKLLLPLGYDPIILEVVLHHHEDYDGTGYPDRLKGEDISIYSRLLRIVDTFDALTSKRAYRMEMSELYTRNEMEKLSGTWFDPALLKVFFEKVVHGNG